MIPDPPILKVDDRFKITDAIYAGKFFEVVKTTDTLAICEDLNEKRTSLTTKIQYGFSNPLKHYWDKNQLRIQESRNEKVTTQLGHIDHVSIIYSGDIAFRPSPRDILPPSVSDPD